MIRVTVDLNEVIVGHRKYLSTMAQCTIDKYNPMDLIDLEKQTKETLEDAESEIFIAIPPPPIGDEILRAKNAGISEKTLENRKLYERIRGHIPATKIEIVNDLFFG